MRKNILFMIFIGCLLFSACYHEDDITAELGQYPRVYDSTSTDPVKKFEADYYYKYGKTFITDPDTADYVYNFQTKNSLRIVKPVQNNEHLLFGISFVKELFMDAYSDEVVNEFFPFSIILSDTIISHPRADVYNKLDMTSSRNFLAFTIDNSKRSFTEVQKEEWSIKMHLMFLVDYCMNYDLLKIPADFYAVSQSKYGKHDGHLTPEECYAMGFVSWSYTTDWWGDKYTWFVTSNSDDLKKFLIYLINTDEEEIQKVISTYPALKTKYELVTMALMEQVNVDYKTLGYKAKN